MTIDDFKKRWKELVRQVHPGLEPEIHAFVAHLIIELASAREALEQLRVQLAGCSVAALGCATGENDALKGMYGWSPAFQDVKNLRAAHERLREAAKALLDKQWGPAEIVGPIRDRLRDILEVKP